VACLESMNRKLVARCLAELGNLTRLDIYRLLVRTGPPGLNISDIQTVSTYRPPRSPFIRASWLAQASSRRKKTGASSCANIAANDLSLPGRVDHLRTLSPGSSAIHYGWIILGAGTFGSFMTLPGQTAGVSVFFDPITADLGISRTSASIAYAVGTLAGILPAPVIGRWIDRRGPRLTATIIARHSGCCHARHRIDRKLCCRPHRLLWALSYMWRRGF
jgi:hypothetical protein